MIRNLLRLVAYHSESDTARLKREGEERRRRMIVWAQAMELRESRRRLVLADPNRPEAGWKWAA